jgi:hypothetical protein
MRIIFCFDNHCTFSASEDFGSALNLSNVCDLRQYDDGFQRCLDAILHWEVVGHQTELKHYYIADVPDIVQAKQVTTALRLMEVGFTGAYLYEKEMSSYIWEPLLDLASALQQAKGHRPTIEAQYYRLRLKAPHCLSATLGGQLLRTVSKCEASIGSSLKAAIHVLKSSVSEIEIS